VRCAKTLCSDRRACGFSTDSSKAPQEPRDISQPATMCTSVSCSDTHVLAGYMPSSGERSGEERKDNRIHTKQWSWWNTSNIATYPVPTSSGTCFKLSISDLFSPLILSAGTSTPCSGAVTLAIVESPEKGKCTHYTSTNPTLFPVQVLEGPDICC
jgi:hypothetical protein